MAERISRRKLAVHVADRLEREDVAEATLQELAAYLIDTKRTREADLVARSIEDELAARGTVVAHVSSARPLSSDIKESIQRLLNASTIHLTEEVDPGLIGGVRIEAPGKRLDATLKRNILALGQAKM